MKMSKKVKVMIWGLAILPLIVTALVYSKLPAEIPMNWGFDGTVEYSEKWQIWITSGMSVMFSAMFMVLPKIDPKKRNYDKFQGAYNSFCIIMMLFLLGMNLMVLSESFYPGRIKVSAAVVVFVGLLFTYLGNVMPKMKSNYFMGIKTPWTLANPEVWNKTHRLAGIVWFVSGILIILMPFILKETTMFVVLMVFVAIDVLIPTVMSYIWYGQLEKSSDFDANTPTL